MGKPRLLIIGDQGVNTGFERVVRGITQHLYELGEYDITVRGLSFFDQAHSVREYPWLVKPWGGQKDDPCGVTNFTSWIKEDKPDVILIVQDLWNVTNYLSYKPREIPAVVYFPVDTPNLKPMFCVGLAAASEVVTYTHFGAQEAASGMRRMADMIFRTRVDEEFDTIPLVWSALPKGPMELHLRWDRFARFQNLKSWNIVPHGLEAGVFEKRDKVAAREFIGIPQDAFVVLNVNTNQFRKRLDLTLRAFKLLVDKVPEAFMVFHCAGGDEDGWDILDLAEYLGIPSDRIACVHYAVPKLTDDQLCWLYNCADVQINTAGGEGWGLTSFEGAACGVPQMVPNWSATRELWGSNAIQLKVDNYRVYERQLNTCHAEIDVVDAAKALIMFARNPDIRTTYSERALKVVADQKSWDEVGAAFHKIIQNALKEPEAKTVTKLEIIAGRDPDVKSELAGKPTLGV